MKSILIVDDSYQKIQDVSASLRGLPGVVLTCELSVKDALEKIDKDRFDLLIVDIQIPIFTGGDIESDGGKTLVERISLSTTAHRPGCIIAVTSHVDAFDSYADWFKDSGWITLKYPEENEIMRRIISSKIQYLDRRNVEVDYAIVTALANLELEAVLKLPFSWEKTEKHCDTVFYFGRFTNKNGEEKTVVASACSRMGMSASATMTAKICERFSPKIVLMTGIAAGIEGKAEIGDILIADPTWDWGNGKKTIVEGKIEFLSAPHQIPLSSKLRSVLKDISISTNFVSEICDNWSWPGKPDNRLSVRIGPVATGAVVLEDPSTIAEIKRQHRETVGIEMEGYGVALACSEAKIPTEFIIIKSVCDFADTNKNDDWQSYAAYTSAKFAEKLLLEAVL